MKPEFISSGGLKDLVNRVMQALNSKLTSNAKDALSDVLSNEGTITYHIRANKARSAASADTAHQLWAAMCLVQLETHRTLLTDEEFWSVADRILVMGRLGSPDGEDGSYKRETRLNHLRSLQDVAKVEGLMQTAQSIAKITGALIGVYGLLTLSPHLLFSGAAIGLGVPKIIEHRNDIVDMVMHRIPGLNRSDAKIIADIAAREGVDVTPDPSPA